MSCHLEGSILNSQREISKVRLLTHALDKTVDDLEGLCCGRPSLVLGETV